MKYMLSKLIITQGHESVEDVVDICVEGVGFVLHGTNIPGDLPKVREEGCTHLIKLVESLRLVLVLPYCPGRESIAQFDSAVLRILP